MTDKKSILIGDEDPIPGFSQEEISHYRNYIEKNYAEDHDGTLIMRFHSDGILTFAHRLLFHWTVKKCAIGDYFGYDDRYCFATEELAHQAIRAWNEPRSAECPGRWHRHPLTGRRRLWAPDGSFSEHTEF